MKGESIHLSLKNVSRPPVRVVVSTKQSGKLSLFQSSYIELHSKHIYALLLMHFVDTYSVYTKDFLLND